MNPDTQKRLLAAAWAALTVIVALASNVGSMPGWGLVAAIALAPPVVMLVLWKPPPQTTTERINSARQ